MQQAVMTFTVAQINAMRHRLDCPDCIADALTDSAEGVAPTVPDTWEHVYGETVALVTRIVVAISRTPDNQHMTLSLDAGDSLLRAILIDSVEGSTWVAANDHHPAAETAAIRTLLECALIIEEAYALPQGTIQVPNS